MRPVGRGPVCAGDQVSSKGQPAMTALANPHRHRQLCILCAAGPAGMGYQALANAMNADRHAKC